MATRDESPLRPLPPATPRSAYETYAAQKRPRKRFCATALTSGQRKTPSERGFLRSPLPDSNRRPLPYHGGAAMPRMALQTAKAAASAPNPVVYRAAAIGTFRHCPLPTGYPGEYSVPSREAGVVAALADDVIARVLSRAPTGRRGTRPAPVEHAGRRDRDGATRCRRGLPLPRLVGRRRDRLRRCAGRPVGRRLSVPRTTKAPPERGLWGSA